MRYIALDLGSSFTKCALLDISHATVEVIEVTSAPEPKSMPTYLHEIDADIYENHVRTVLDRALSIEANISGIVMSAQMHGCIVALENGKPVTGLISWQDTAGLQIAHDGLRYVDILANRLADHTDNPNFVPIKRKLAIGNLFARTDQGLELPKGALFCSPGGYIALKLCGQTAFHVTQAASTGCSTAQGNCWYPPAIGAAGLSSLRFPRIDTGYMPIGTYAFRGEKIPVYPDIGDHQAAVLGSLARESLDLHVNIGTGGMAGRIARGFLQNASWETRPLLGNLSVHTITGLPGGRHLRMIANFLRETAAALTDQTIEEKRLWAYVTNISSTEGPFPHIDGNFWLNSGSITNIRADALRPDALLHALYESIGEKCAAAADSLGPVERLIYTGGAVSRNPAMRRAIERACKLPGIVVPGNGTLYGLLRLAYLINGISLEKSREILMHHTSVSSWKNQRTMNADDII